MSEQYDLYLQEHCNNVVNAFKWLVDHGIVSIEAMGGDATNIYEHDKSKYTAIEYDAYDKYFYDNKNYSTERAFNYAWLNHIHNNPHHWQYWVLLEDDPSEDKKYVTLPIPYKYVVEMICDWWSFGWKSGNLYEIFDRYEDYKHKMKLHDGTRDYVEQILSEIKVNLDMQQADRSDLDGAEA